VEPLERPAINPLRLTAVNLLHTPIDKPYLVSCLLEGPYTNINDDDVLAS
jgi:hypothetical protein